MPRPVEELSADLDEKLEAWARVGGGGDHESPAALLKLFHDSVLLLAEVFIELPLGRFDEFVDRGIQLARPVRVVARGQDDAARAHARLAEIQRSAELRADPGRRLEELVGPARTFLMNGFLAEFALCTEATGDAHQQLERHMQASIFYRRALLIVERLGLAQHEPRLLLSTAQMFRYESERGRFDWDGPQWYFDECYAKLETAPLDERERRRLRAACLIDRAPCYVETARRRLEVGGGSVAELRAGIAEARRSVEDGIALAEQDPALGQYVRQGRLNAFRLDQIEATL